MSRIALVTNSASALPADLVERYNIVVVPMVLNFLDGNYEEGVDMSLSEFYSRLVREPVIPITSPPSAPKYARTFRSLAEQNYDAILSVHISSHLSASYQNAVEAARDVSDVRILVHDSGSVALGTGFQVLTAARLREQGASVEQIMAALHYQRERTLALFTPATLRFMRNSRRVGPIASLVATWFNIKPVVRVVDGRLYALDRPRSWSSALERQIDELAAFLDGEVPVEIGICHANAPDAVAAIMPLVQERFSGTTLRVADLGAVIATHVGPGGVGLATYRS